MLLVENRALILIYTFICKIWLRHSSNSSVFNIFAVNKIIWLNGNSQLNMR